MKWGLQALVFLTLVGCDSPTRHRNEPRPDPPMVVRADPPPPPIFGGTLSVLPDGLTVFVADPDRDRVLFFDIVREEVVHEIALDPGDLPWRSAAISKTEVFVSLRGSDSVLRAAVDGAQSRIRVCDGPRGLAFDPETLRVIVACTTGEVVVLSANTGKILERWRLDSDLRDVVIDEDRIVITRFRTAEVLVLNRAGELLEKLRPQEIFLGDSLGPDNIPGVAWRAVPLPGVGVVVLHQRSFDVDLSATFNSYSAGVTDRCGSALVHSAVSLLIGGRELVIGPAFPTASLVVDLAFSTDGQHLAVISAGDSQVLLPDHLLESEVLSTTCAFPQLEPGFGGVVAAVILPNGTLVQQIREPAELLVNFTSFALGGDSRLDSGHELFHRATPARIACASCHPEGEDDGRVWKFGDFGLRRTQWLPGGVLSRTPFHWNGELPGVQDLVDEVFSKRMGAGEVEPELPDALGRWLDAIPLPTASGAITDASVERGRALFEDSRTSCTSCHSGPSFSDNLSHDVGTGGPFQTPTLLGLARRPPYMHNGCAPTLRDRFASCGGFELHGQTAHLSETELSDLIAFLHSL